MDQASIREAVTALLAGIGEDPSRADLQATPDRVARMYEEVFSGIGRDPADELDVSFSSSYDELILLRDIPFASFCEHHLLPFTGKAHVGYVPNGRGQITGLSKLARVVDVAARRPQVQERLTVQIADALTSRLEPKGLIVVIEAEHLCMAIRGVAKPGATMVTSVVRGALRANPATREEAMRLIRGA